MKVNLNWRLWFHILVALMTWNSLVATLDEHDDGHQHEPAHGYIAPEQVEHEKWAFMPHTSESEDARRSSSETDTGWIEHNKVDNDNPHEQLTVPNEPPLPVQVPPLDSLESVHSEPLERELSPNHGEYDDRTLLDVFAESTKEYLTKRVIPDTDPECKWDWRSLRCEPACQCRLDYQPGDYHLGRSCRLLPPNQIVQGDDCTADNTMPRRIILLDQPIPKRFFSLVGQTGRILLEKSTQAALQMKGIKRLQLELCEEIWSLQDNKEECLTALPIRTIPERLLCGPVVDLQLCSSTTTTTTTTDTSIDRKEEIVDQPP